MNSTLDRLPILVLEPHARCNCRCVMCDIWKRTDASEISALGFEWAWFTGGEPLMHSDLFRLASLFRERGIRTTILSTGLLLERDAARIVETIGDVIISLDGPEKVHDEIRRVPGAFERMASGITAIRTLSPAYPISAR